MVPAMVKKNPRRGFTLIELLVVIGIIVLLAGMSVPAIKSLTKSNDQTQATNLVRSMLSAARSIAISQHRMAGVVFFEETPRYSRPVNGGRTAMQIFVEDFNQQQYSQGGAVVPTGVTVFVYYSMARQYLPVGTRAATLADIAGVPTDLSVDSNTPGPSRSRSIVFDANGQTVLRRGIAAPFPGAGNSEPDMGTYPTGYGDWQFLTPNGKFNDGAGSPTASRTSPGVFVFNQAELASLFPPGRTPDDATTSAWIKQHADLVLVNPNTGNFIR
jgi:prepilin-type N-terminal cleavage/methylation domain-containing protein